MYLRIGSSWPHEHPTVDTAFGKIEGHYKYSYGKRQFSAFEGIPYIKPPIGELRFEEPQAPEHWSEVLNATRLKSCVQQMPLFPLMGDEDCAYLNVYVPRTQPTPAENLDVIVHIHGGGFVGGSASIAGPYYIMDKDVVYVNFNYRIGIFGFLSTGDAEIPGNYGLKDQVFALKWVKDNIQYFGGNPDSVTILGGSAGGVSVHLQYFSPLSKGLFHRGISQSGTALAPWALVNNPLKNAVKLAHAVGCPTTSTREVKRCLKSKPANTLYENINVVYPLGAFPISPFGPVVERKSKTAFLTKNPHTLLKQGAVHDVPWLSSATTDEGLLILMWLNDQLTALEDKWNEKLPYFLEYHDVVDDSEKSFVSDKIKDFYKIGNPLQAMNLVKVYGDRLFAQPFERAARMQAKVTKSPVYAYLYGHEHEMEETFMPRAKGKVGHGEDGRLLYDVNFEGIPLKLEKLSAGDEAVKDLLIEMVTSFAKKGIPKINGIDWSPVTGGKNFEYLFLKSADSINMKYEEELTPLSFWNSLPLNEYDRRELRSSSWQDKHPTVDTAFGKIQGHYKYSYGKRQFSAFEGIPYIKPPIGDLRFEEPQAPEPWSGVLNATRLNSCTQKMSQFSIIGDENCAYLNVYVPRTHPTPAENLDVIVHIHGGAFVAGSASIAGPYYIMDRNVVYVNFNYRIGIFGFLSTGDEEMPGNYGLKDQVFVLKWVKDNIQYFGGNPDSVTILGASAGGVSVHLQYFSPLSKGLFHRGISQSGTALAPWGIVNNPLENAVKLAHAVGCPTTSTKDMKTCLKSKPANTLYENINVAYQLGAFPVSPFGPVLERKSETAFLTKNPHSLLKQGAVRDLPWLSSATTDEGILIRMLLNDQPKALEDNWNEMLPYVLEYHDKIDDSDESFVSNKIKDFYNIGDHFQVMDLVKVYGDRLFAQPFERAARMQAKVTKSPVYAYFYGHEHELEGTLFPRTKGKVGHAEDLSLLYDMKFEGFPLKLEKLSAGDEEVKDLLVEMVTSFAKEGIPKIDGIDWSPVTGGDNFEYLFIQNADSTNMKSAEELTPLSFWNSLPLNEYDKLKVRDEL
ncbi:hypothetical protein FQA39_LY01806 [Lamprigera yunnana]|nr:hypothetical protein FQA39_LY01806 [Lamprigera yunnana]